MYTCEEPKLHSEFLVPSSIFCETNWFNSVSQTAWQIRLTCNYVKKMHQSKACRRT